MMQQQEIAKIEVSSACSRAGFEITRVMFMPERNYELWQEEIDERGEC